jgi:hypothetical protein
VRVEGAVKSLDDLAGIVVKNVAGVPVRVSDVAQVRLGSLTRYGGVSQDGKGEAVEGLVLGLRGANAQQVVKAVKQRLAEIAPTLPKGVTVRPFYDRSAWSNAPSAPCPRPCWKPSCWCWCCCSCSWATCAPRSPWRSPAAGGAGHLPADAPASACRPIS